MLLKRLIEDFPEVKKIVNLKAEKLCNVNIAPYELNKENIPDLGNLIVLLCFADKNITKNKQILRSLIKEYLARKIFWIFNKDMKDKELRDKATGEWVEFFMNDPNLAYTNFYEFPETGFVKNNKLISDKKNNSDSDDEDNELNSDNEDSKKKISMMV